MLCKKLRPELNLVSSLEIISRNYRIDPSQYNYETEQIKRTCKERHIPIKSLVTLDWIDEVYLPNRFSRLYTESAKGVPMLGTSSMFNMRLPTGIRIFLTPIKNGKKLYIKENDILISRSGTVGTSVFCGKSYEDFVASDDCIRLRVKTPYSGYIAAYLRSVYGFALLAKDAHGKVIKHLKIQDVENLPVMLLPDDWIAKINKKMHESRMYYDRARDILNDIEDILQEFLGHILPACVPEGNIIGFSELILGRVDPHMYEAKTNYMQCEIKKIPHRRISDIADVITVPRFKRHYVEQTNRNRVALYSSADIVRANLSPSKYISEKLNHRNIVKCLVSSEDIIIPCSGTYGGILGKGVITGNLLDGKCVSQHVIRIVKKNDVKINIFYVAAVLCSPQFGYPLITATRFGKDIPELDPKSIELINIPWLDDEKQKFIADKFKQAVEYQEKANILENDATKLFEKFYQEQ